MISIESEEINFELSSRFMHTLRTIRTEFNDLISTQWRARLKIFAWTKFVHARRWCTLRQGYIDGDGNVEKTEKCRKQCSLSMGAQHTHIYDFITFITFQEARSFSQQVRCMRKEFSKGIFYAEKSNPIFMRLEYFRRLRCEYALQRQFSCWFG